MHKNIIPYLEDLESRILPGEEEALLKEWRTFSDGNAGPFPFRPAPRTARPSRISWPKIPVNKILKDLDLMIISQLELCHNQLSQGAIISLRVFQQ